VGFAHCLCTKPKRLPTRTRHLNQPSKTTKCHPAHRHPHPQPILPTKGLGTWHRNNTNHCCRLFLYPCSGSVFAGLGFFGITTIPLTNSPKQTKVTPHNTMFMIIKAGEFVLWLNPTTKYKAKETTYPH
jgi:hypothetical protein